MLRGWRGQMRRWVGMGLFAAIMLGATGASALAESKNEYYRVLLRKKPATVEDVVRACARYKGYEATSDMKEELTFLFNMGIKFRPDIEKMKDVPLTKGNAVHILLTAMGYKGGFMYRLFPNSQRFALREAIYMNMVPSESTVDEVMSGGDLLTLLAKVAEETDKQKKGAEGSK